MMDENSKLAEPRDARDVMMEAMVPLARSTPPPPPSATDSATTRSSSPPRSAACATSSTSTHARRALRLALHLGLTEAGMGMKGIVASTAGLAPLLLAGIGDTIRVSLTPKPGGDRTEEVRCAQQILQSLSIRSFTPQVTACPGCGRTTSTYFQELAQQMQNYLARFHARVARSNIPAWKR